MAVDLVDLKGEERAGDDDGEPLGPAFQQPQADALGEEQSCIDKTDNAEFPDSAGRKVGGLFNDAIHVAAAWIEAEHPDPVLKLPRKSMGIHLRMPEAGADRAGRFTGLESGQRSLEFS